MQRRFTGAGRRALPTVSLLLTACVAALLVPAASRADRALADRANEAARRLQPAASAQLRRSSDYQPLFALDYVKSAGPADCQVPVPPVGAVSPFPIALRLGALVSPRFKFDGGIDATIPGVHLFPGLSTRVDADAIVSANFGGVSTLVPVTFDQIYNLNLPVGSRVYVGAGIGPYFGDRTRFGGKLIAGAEFNRIGLEGNLHFAGTGDTLFTVQARIGL